MRGTVLVSNVTLMNWKLPSAHGAKARAKGGAKAGAKAGAKLCGWTLLFDL
jgi:hypothetical protein